MFEQKVKNTLLDPKIAQELEKTGFESWKQLQVLQNYKMKLKFERFLLVFS